MILWRDRVHHHIIHIIGDILQAGVHTEHFEMGSVNAMIDWRRPETFKADSVKKQGSRPFVACF